MKRAVGPGQTIPLDELYEQYGKRYNLKKGKEFIEWLQDVKLRDKNKWRIFTNEDKPYGEISKLNTETKEESEVQGATVVKTDTSRGENVTPLVVKDMEVGDVVELSVRQAREIVPTIKDIQLLKYAEKIANQRTGKDSLRRILLRRIQELSVSGRL